VTTSWISHRGYLGAISRLAFTIMVRERCLRVEVDHENATYALLYGDPLEVSHHGEPVTVRVGALVVRPVVSAPPRERPVQPPGRAPARH
jgi:alpha,alpha-trehalose phosphorylase